MLLLKTSVDAAPVMRLNKEKIRGSPPKISAQRQITRKIKKGNAEPEKHLTLHCLLI